MPRINWSFVFSLSLLLCVHYNIKVGRIVGAIIYLYLNHVHRIN